MKPLLLLHNSYTPDDRDITNVATRRGWEVQRALPRLTRHYIRDRPNVRYYGNPHDARAISNLLPQKFIPLNHSILASASQFTKRKIYLTTLRLIPQPLTARCFIKPVEGKWFPARVYEKGEKIVTQPAISDQVYISEPVIFIDEVRCFVLNGEILTASYYIFNRQHWDRNLSEKTANFDAGVRDTPIPAMVAATCRKFNIAGGIVIDFGRTKDNDWSIVEFNEAWCSGLYLCDYDKCFTTIINSQYDAYEIFRSSTSLCH